MIDAFDFELVACLAQHEKNLATAILARNEPFGLIPSEARLLVRKSGGLLLVPEDGGGLTEQVRDGVDGFVVRNAEDPDALLAGIDAVAGLAPAKAEAIRGAGVDSVFDGGYTWSARILETLSALDPAVAEVRAEVTGSIAETERAGL